MDQWQVVVSVGAARSFAYTVFLGHAQQSKEIVEELKVIEAEAQETLNPLSRLLPFADRGRASFLSEWAKILTVLQMETGSLKVAWWKMKTGGGSPLTHLAFFLPSHLGGHRQSLISRHQCTGSVASD